MQGCQWRCKHHHWALGFRLEGLRFEVQRFRALRFRASGVRFRVSGFGCAGLRMFKVADEEPMELNQGLCVRVQNLRVSQN